MKFVRSHAVAVFVLGTFAWSWGIWLTLIATGLPAGSRVWDSLYVAGLSGPMVMAVAVSLLNGGREGLWSLIRRSLRGGFRLRWFAIALAVPPVLVLSSVIFSDWLMVMPFKLPHPTAHMLVAYFGLMMLRSGPLNEELGWRGFLLPRLLHRFNPLGASLILAPTWTLWHLPLWFLPLLPHKYWPFSWFVLIVFPTTFLFTWLFLRTNGNVLIAILFHTAINASLYYLPILPPNTPSFVPFALWIASTWALTIFVVIRNWQEWLLGKSLAPLLNATPQVNDQSPGGSPVALTAGIRACPGTENGSTPTLGN